MIDYISTTTSFSGKDNTFLTHLQLEAVYNSGWRKYHLEGCEKLSVWIQPSLQLLKLEGSISYYWQGHNFSFNRRQFVEAINHIEGLLNVDLWKSTVNAFEFGVIMQVNMKPKEYIRHHYSVTKEKLTLNEKQKDKGKFRWWSDQNVSLKMYDAGRNIQMKQGLERKEIITQSGWEESGEYLKWEVHYIKPESLNKGKGLHLYNLVNPDWHCILKEDLYLQYKRLIPTKGIITPQDKKNLTTAGILIITMVEEAVNEGRTIEQVKKAIYDKINSIANHILTKPDKDFRKAQVRKLLSNIKGATESIYDLSNELQKALEADK
ncbi:hypothetical protein CJ231_01150 [Hoylesella buccalis]|uniref:Replication initiation factor domain-containing protein n=1 Tax=Hoylesella buccalis TaxID=28127 RepID=A0A2N6QTR1_9BACT|nr:hypothetical protein [Hoylesella buccalis]PMC25434.1 hypothetical protein CJ231_01150 [Hoylesella buccalis]